MHTDTDTQEHPDWLLYQDAENAPFWDAEKRKLARTADHLFLRFRPVIGAPSWRRDSRWVDFEFVHPLRGGGQARTQFQAAGKVSGGFADATRRAGSDGARWTQYSEDSTNVYAPGTGVWVVNLYPGQATHAWSVLQTLPLGASLVITANLDTDSSPIMAESGLHGDVLYLHLRKGKRQYSFRLDTQVSRHNSARFGDLKL